MADFFIIFTLSKSVLEQLLLIKWEVLELDVESNEFGNWMLKAMILAGKLGSSHIYFT